MKADAAFADQHNPAEQSGVLGLDDLRHQRQHVGQRCAGNDELKNAVLPCEKIHLLSSLGLQQRFEFDALWASLLEGTSLRSRPVV